MPSEIADMIADVRRLDKAATPGPRTFERHRAGSEWLGNIVGSYGRDSSGIESIRTISCQTLYGEPKEAEANAEATAAFRTIAPALADALEKLVAVIVRIECPHPDCVGGLIRDHIGHKAKCGFCSGTGIHPNATALLASIGLTLEQARKMTQEK